MPELTEGMPGAGSVAEHVVGSIASLIAWGAERLRQGGIAAPRREALQLLADLRGTTPASMLLAVEQRLGSADEREFRARIERRAAGEPRAYVSAVAGFRRLVLRCDRRALIPRPETEGLVDLVLERGRTGVAADIGTGTGCIALSLAAEGSFRSVIAVDRSAEALALADTNRRTAAASQAPAGIATVRLLRGDLTTSLGPETLDALVSNPPYLTELEYASVDPSVRDWEPAAALVSGADGLDATARLLDDGRRVLRPGGLLALEVDCTRAAAAARRAADLGWLRIEIFNDLFGRARYLLAQRSDNS